jgi:hypothetical protein
MHPEPQAKDPCFVGSEKSENIFQERRISWNKKPRELRLSGLVRRALLKGPKTL